MFRDTAKMLSGTQKLFSRTEKLLSGIENFFFRTEKSSRVKNNYTGMQLNELFFLIKKLILTAAIKTYNIKLLLLLKKHQCFYCLRFFHMSRAQYSG